MKPSVRVMLAAAAFLATPASAAFQCRGVFEFENGELRGRFQCHYTGTTLRRVGAACHDGEPGCDADGACDGVCRFALCADDGCATTFDVSVPLRRGGRAKGSSTFRSGDTRVTLRCLPPRSGCAPGGPTTTITPASTTTTTTLPCTGTLSGAVTSTFSCTASLERSALLLPVFSLELTAPDADGSAAALLVTRRAGSYTLGKELVVMVAKIARPDLPTFEAPAVSEAGSAELRLDSVSPRGEVHGALDATLPSVAGRAPLHVEAQF